MTYTLSSQKDTTINMVFSFYNKLFKKLENKENDTMDDTTLCEAVKAAKEKLSQYYTETDGEYRCYYNLAYILDPQIKLSFYKVCFLDIIDCHILMYI